MSERIFISYSHDDAESAARLAEELQARGFRTWQDVHDIRLGKRIESEVERGISSCDGVLHLLTPDALDSPAVRREIELAARRRRRDSEFAVFGAARALGDSHEEVGKRTLAAVGENFARDWLERLTDGPEPVDLTEAAAFARKVLQSSFPRGEGRGSDAWRIGLHTRGLAGGSHDLDLDWRALLGPDERTPGTYDSWRRAWQAVRDVREILCEHSDRRRVELVASAHQTAGILFGLTFCANARFELAVVDQERVEWTRGAAGAEIAPFQISRQPESLEGSYLTVEIEVARTVLSAVSERIADLGEEPRARILVCRPDGPEWTDPATGAVLARAIALESKRAVDDLPVGRVEIYPAAPLPLCVLLGAELGALHAELALFEFHGGRYEPSVTIPEEEQ